MLQPQEDVYKNTYLYEIIVYKSDRYESTEKDSTEHKHDWCEI